MNYIDHYKSFDLLRDSVIDPIYLQAANLGHRLIAAVAQGSRHNVITGTVQMVYELPDGTKSDVQMTIDNGCAVCVIPHAVTENPGTVKAEIRIYGEGGTFLSTPKFDIIVGSVIYDEDAMTTIVSDPTVYEAILASEAQRVANEETRVENETARGNAESNRGYNETARNQAELARQQAEAARAAAEAERQAKHYITYEDLPDWEIDDELSNTSKHAVQNKVIYAELADKLYRSELATELLFYAKVSDLATVATSGDYGDLRNQPTIPTVPEISTSIATDKASDAKTASPKAVYEYAAKESEFAYKNGDHFAIGEGGDCEYGLPARVSADQTEIHCLLVTEKSMKDVTALSVSSANAGVCKADGTSLYLNAGKGVTGWTATATKYSANRILLVFKLSSGTISAAAGEAVTLEYPEITIGMTVA